MSFNGTNTSALMSKRSSLNQKSRMSSTSYYSSNAYSTPVKLKRTVRLKHDIPESPAKVSFLSRSPGNPYANRESPKK